MIQEHQRGKLDINGRKSEKQNENLEITIVFFLYQSCFFFTFSEKGFGCTFVDAGSNGFQVALGIQSSGPKTYILGTPPGTWTSGREFDYFRLLQVRKKTHE